ncbi:short-chain dehydrogenase/reductase family 42E member 1 [Aplysia californica]|uniref:Short-chain dehydrogenase/reductase family 42E member 1 n=1 Tax=Aplysia californica TaxID=6500 RepID=A0ABM0ZZN7_APLCA|nr:short-chain dehydrogenase/reductase family 42E member 1 [Aplysia californica]
MVQTRSSAQSRDKEIHVVTGGGGFPGFSLAKYLARKGHHVKLIDVKEPVWDLEANMEFIKGSICDDNQLQSVVEGASAVYHMASYGMSGREQVGHHPSLPLHNRIAFDIICFLSMTSCAIFFIISTTPTPPFFSNLHFVPSQISGSVSEIVCSH